MCGPVARTTFLGRYIEVAGCKDAICQMKISKVGCKASSYKNDIKQRYESLLVKKPSSIR